MNLRFESSSIDHLEVFLRWRTEPNTLKYNPVNLSASPEKIKEGLLESLSDLANLQVGHEYRFFVKDSETLVGTISLTNVNVLMKHAELGYIVAEEHQGKGYGGAILKNFVDMVFSKSDLRKLIATVAEGNLASARMLERVGFKREGLLREHFLIGGVPTNEIVFGLLRSEWEAK